MLNWIRSTFSNPAVLDAIRVTFIMAFASTLISSVVGIAAGLWLQNHNFPGKRVVIRINRTLMGVPPVVIGLVVYLLTMRGGLLGPLSLLFTVKGMILAQIMIITPIISGMVFSYADSAVPEIRAFAKTMGANKRQTDRLILSELRNELYFCMITGFGRAISEVGSVMLVGGNIKGRTRTMTTMISLLKSQGIYSEGIGLGLLLLVMAFILQTLGDHLRKEQVRDENY
ncbi:MAG: ABC transporter permease [Lachnospiraceae bacterium]|nr:ABC transporter permease [Lachnospiraceae bacterium]